MTERAFQTRLALLLDGQTPRVWSLLVTVFGDLAQASGARLSGAAVGAITAAIGIKPEATRVALHRLRKEGWIDSLRRGRQTSYGLTAPGREQSSAASPRIYDMRRPEGPAWLALPDPAQGPGDMPPGAVQLAPHVLLSPHCPAAPAQPAHTLWLELPAETELPGWLSQALCPGDLRAAAAGLAARLAALEKALADRPVPDPLQRAVLRVLVVHEWRRIALRVPPLPDRLFPEDWQGPACRAATARLLRLMPAPEIDRLEAVIATGRAA